MGILKIGVVGCARIGKLSSTTPVRQFTATTSA